MKPLAIDLFCGLGGWSEALLAEGYDVIGFDIERHEYGDHRYPGLLVIQDARTLHGAQFKDATLIVASPPCQAYSYRAMPWKRAKALPPPDNTLFETCFRLQREACAAAGRHIPMVVENVRGAQKWVGRARWNFGSFYLWGDVPALMPVAFRAAKVPGLNWSGSDKPGYVARGFNTTADQRVRDGQKTPGTIPHIRAGAPHTKHLTNPAEHEGQGIKARIQEGIKNPNGGSWNRDRPSWTPNHSWDSGTKNTAAAAEGRKGAGAGAAWFDGNLCQLPSNSSRRKMASAMIAKIPLPLGRHIAATFRPL